MQGPARAGLALAGLEGVALRTDAHIADTGQLGVGPPHPSESSLARELGQGGRSRLWRAARALVDDLLQAIHHL